MDIALYSTSPLKKLKYGVPCRTSPASIKSVFGFSLRTRFTRVARRATPPLPAYILSFSRIGSICECVSFVCRIVIKVSPFAGRSNGAEIDNAGMRRLKRDDPRNSGNETPATAAVFRKCLRVVIFVNLNLEQHTSPAFPRSDDHCGGGSSVMTEFVRSSEKRSSRFGWISRAAAVSDFT